MALVVLQRCVRAATGRRLSVIVILLQSAVSVVAAELRRRGGRREPSVELLDHRDEAGLGLRTR